MMHFRDRSRNSKLVRVKQANWFKIDNAQILREMRPNSESYYEDTAEGRDGVEKY